MKPFILEVLPEENGKGAILLGNQRIGYQFKIFYKNNIKALLSTNGNKLKYMASEIHKHLHLYILDSRSFDISKHFDQAHQFIKDNRKLGNVLIQSQNVYSVGMTLVLAYLIKQNKCSYEKAVNLVEMKCKGLMQVQNQGFIEQLKKYQQNRVYLSECRMYPSVNENGNISSRSSKHNRSYDKFRQQKSLHNSSTSNFSIRKDRNRTRLYKQNSIEKILQDLKFKSPIKNRLQLNVFKPCNLKRDIKSPRTKIYYKTKKQNNLNYQRHPNYNKLNMN